ncbi:MAG: hypothetical protein GY806_16665 [Gammaproteobacteria bacterium]|nr:hypothetical protein [Gammaproteobacteria bacterium]
MTQLLNQWLFCVKHFTLMSVFASSPERLPYRMDCLILTIFCYCLLGLTLVDEQLNYVRVLLQIALEISLLALLCYGGLKWLKKLPRFTQCFSALVGVNFVISAVSIPVANWLSADVGNEIESKLLYVTMAIVFWNLAVMSQIIKRSFEINTVMSAMIAFNYFLIYQFSVLWLY